MVDEPIDRETIPENQSPEPYGTSKMENKLFHLLEWFQSSETYLQALDLQSVHETRIYELINEEVDVRISHISRDL